jgi:hypothetical protein
VPPTGSAGSDARTVSLAVRVGSQGPVASRRLEPFREHFFTLHQLI